MILNENVSKWSSIINETLGVDNKQGKLDWMSQYAVNHEIYEGVQQGDPAGGIYSTPLNTLGMGNPNMPYNAEKPVDKRIKLGKYIKSWFWNIVYVGIV